MKRALLILSSLSLLSVACAVEPFSNVVESDGAAGNSAVAGAAGSGTAAAGSAGKATGGGAGKAGGSAGKTSQAGAAGASGAAAGEAGESGAPATGAGGSTSGGAGSGNAGAPTAGSGSVAPTCTETQAVRVNALPSKLTIPAWTNSFDADGVCWSLAETTCTFSAELGVSPVDANSMRLSLSDIRCDKPVMYGKGTALSCTGEADCSALSGGSVPMLVIDFTVAPSGNGYVAKSIQEKASNPGPSSALGCELIASNLADALFTAGSDFLIGTTFSCSAP